MTRRSILSWIVVAVLGLGLLAAVVRLAWISDDAYITLRTVENVLAGHGPVWNPGERVQTYTHPLWFLLLVVARWLTGEHYFTTIVLSVLATAAGVVLLALSARRPLAIAAVLVLLLGSRAFGDYATSGLETPLVTLLLAWLALVDVRTPLGSVRCLPVAALLGLLLTTRLDLAVLAGPVLLAHARGDRALRVVTTLAIGLSPWLVWTSFATFYYGSPLPITAYAKAIATGVPAGALLAQGCRYAAHTALHDPVTVLAIVAGVGVGAACRELRARLLALGAGLGCLYVLRVGGDFMAGRFFVPPFTVATAVLARWLARARPAAVLAVLLAAGALAFAPGWPPFLAAPSGDVVPVEVQQGIQDERRFYYKDFGLCSPQREIPQFGRFSTALRRQGRTRPIVLGSGMAGGIPFVAGDLFHFVDPWLCDPLLMRLPVADPAQWRIGHFTRAVPDGYPESLAFDDNRLVDPGLRSFYADLRAVVRAPLASAARLSALARLLSGADRAALSSYVEGAYRAPVRVTVAIGELASPPPDGTFWFDEPGVRCVGRGGWRVSCGEPLASRHLHFCATPLVRYRFTFRRGDVEVGHAELLALIDPGVPPAGSAGDVLGYLRRLVGLHSFEIEMPADLPAFDACDVDCEHDPWIQPAVGGMRFVH